MENNCKLIKIFFAAIHHRAVFHRTIRTHPYLEMANNQIFYVYLRENSILETEIESLSRS